MKTIEQFSLRNIVQIEKYLNDKMSPKEKREFLLRLGADYELKDDFDMVVKSFLDEKDKSNPQSPLNSKIKQARQKSVLLNKTDMAKDIVGYGMFAVGVAGALILICSIVVAIIS